MISRRAYDGGGIPKALNQRSALPSGCLECRSRGFRHTALPSSGTGCFHILPGNTAPYGRVVFRFVGRGLAIRVCFYKETPR